MSQPSSTSQPRDLRAPAWLHYNEIFPRPAYVPPPPTSKFAPEGVRHGKDGSLVEKFLSEDAAAFLRHLPITSTTLRVSFTSHVDGKLSAEIHGYSPRKEFDSAVRKMVEENLRQYGLEVLGEKISEASIEQVVEKFRLLGTVDEEIQHADAWGRVGLAVLKWIDLNDAAVLEAVATTTNNCEVSIKVTGFQMPTTDEGVVKTELLAKLIAAEFPDHGREEKGRLGKDEFEFYCQKAIDLDILPLQFRRPNLLATFATAADFPDAVTTLTAVDETEDAPSTSHHHPLEEEAKMSHPTSSSKKKGTAKLPSTLPSPSPTSKPPTNLLEAAFGPAASSPSKQAEETDVTDLLATHKQPKTTILSGQLPPKVAAQAEAHLRFGTTNPSRYDKKKRDLEAAELENNNSPKTPAAKKKRQNKQAARDSDVDSAGLLPTSSAAAGGKKAKKPAKPIPSREEMREAWTAGNVTKFTVPQLRGYLKQEGLFEGFTSETRMNELLKRVRDSEDGV
ncbi:uncharacterized protein RCC_08841 [Ramularia collo-cygni]|uniref:Uncharacterized protein n=1 Tax=Ramularia collo-cygni TaxID=112498 RepID=A0A2D3VG69_9PEZI|nr:uncharacterized protein RCC_08841 [Ramularia collo-cygni]CZT23131.1 uncharacterized protein RCC_08841 [Ramularia collo-cygni]